MTDEFFLTHVPNNLTEKYDVILDGLENHPISSNSDAVMIEEICEKLNDRYVQKMGKGREKN